MNIKPRPAASEVYRRLLAASARGRKMAKKSHDEVVKDPDGAALFRIRQTSHSISLVIPTQKVSREFLSDVRSTLVQLLQRAGAEATASSEQRSAKHLRHKTSLGRVEPSAMTRRGSPETDEAVPATNGVVNV